MFRRKRGKSKPPETPAVSRDEEIDEDETIIIDLSEPHQPSPEAITLELPQEAEVSASSPAVGAPDETVVLTAGSRATASPRPAGPAPEPTSAVDPGNRAGWLVVISDSGFGHAFDLSLGRSTVGRSEANAISIDWDGAVSAEAHAIIAADPKSRKFYVVAGNSTNLAYLNGAPILHTEEASDGDRLQIGETEMVFVQLFGKYVDWR